MLEKHAVPPFAVKSNFACVGVTSRKIEGDAPVEESDSPGRNQNK